MFSDFISLLFPRVCSFCNTPTVKGEELLCTTCLLDLPKTNDHSSGSKTLLNKFVAIPEVVFAYAYLKFTKSGLTQRLLHQLKYEGQHEIGSSIGRWFGNDVKETLHGKSIDLLIPVPIHASRERKRGYNQSDLIAAGLSESLQIEWSNKVIKRSRKTVSQTKQGKVGRWKNVMNIYELMNPDLIQGKHVIVVDDVVTTGATLNTCIQELISAGAKSVGVLTIARAI